MTVKANSDELRLTHAAAVKGFSAVNLKSLNYYTASFHPSHMHQM